MLQPGRSVKWRLGQDQIVTRARVSKRDLYALFNNKHAVLAAGISERAQQMRRPLDPATPAPQTRDALRVLTTSARKPPLRSARFEAEIALLPF